MVNHAIFSLSDTFDDIFRIKHEQSKYLKSVGRLLINISPSSISLRMHLTVRNLQKQEIRAFFFYLSTTGMSGLKSSLSLTVSAPDQLLPLHHSLT